MRTVLDLSVRGERQNAIMQTHISMSPSAEARHTPALSAWLDLAVPLVRKPQCTTLCTIHPRLIVRGLSLSSTSLPHLKKNIMTSLWWQLRVDRLPF